MINKRGFTDSDVWRSPGVVLLTLLGEIGLIAGYIMGKKMGFGALPLWQIIIVMAVIPFAAYYFATRGD